MEQADNLGATDEEIKDSLREDVALAFKTCNQQRERIATLERALLEATSSLETIQEQSGKDECLKCMDQVRGYASSRAKAARAELNVPLEALAPPESYEFLNPDFLDLMNEIGRLGHEKFGADAFEVAGDEKRVIPRHRKAEIMFHAREHTHDYEAGLPHDKLGTVRAHLAAAAFNAMLEFIFSKGE